VDERIGVDAFERAGQRKRIVDLAAACFGRSKTENRPEPFASGEQAIAHRFVNGRRLDVLFRQVAIERAVDQFLSGSEIGFEVHDCHPARRIVAAQHERRII
jgi:hypothetical protein